MEKGATFCPWAPSSNLVTAFFIAMRGRGSKKPFQSKKGDIFPQQTIYRGFFGNLVTFEACRPILSLIIVEDKGGAMLGSIVPGSDALHSSS